MPLETWFYPTGRDFSDNGRDSVEGIGTSRFLSITYTPSIISGFPALSIYHSPLIQDNSSPSFVISSDINVLGDSFNIQRQSVGNFLTFYFEGSEALRISESGSIYSEGSISGDSVEIPVGNQTLDLEQGQFFYSVPDQNATWITSGGREGLLIYLQVDNTANKTITFGTGFVDVDAITETGIQNKLLYYDLVAVAWREIATGGGGGGGTPGGSDTQIQFNDGGALGGDADLTWNKTTNVLMVAGYLAIPKITAKDNNGLILHEDSDTYGITIEDDGDIIIKLGDNAGAKIVTIRDSDGNPVIKINSNGGIVSYSEIGYNAIVDNGNSGSSKTIDWTKGNKQAITTTDNCTLTFTAPTGPCNLQLKIIHNNSAAAYIYTYPGSVIWANNVKYATRNVANFVDIVSLFYDGTYYWTMGNPFKGV